MTNHIHIYRLCICRLQRRLTARDLKNSHVREDDHCLFSNRDLPVGIFGFCFKKQGDLL